MPGHCSQASSTNTRTLSVEHKKLREIAQKSIYTINKNIERLVPAGPVTASTELPPLRPIIDLLDIMRTSSDAPAPPTVLPPLLPPHSQTMAATGQASEPAADFEWPSEIPDVPEGVHGPLWLLSYAAGLAHRALVSPPKTDTSNSSDTDPEASSSQGTVSVPAFAAGPLPPPTLPSQPTACPPPMPAPSQPMADPLLPSPPVPSPPTASSLPPPLSPSAVSQPAAPAANQTAEPALVASPPALPSQPMAGLPPTAAPVPPRHSLPGSSLPTVRKGSRAQKPAAGAAPKREKVKSGRVTKKVASTASAKPEGHKTKWEKAKGDLLAEEKYGREAEEQCTSCSKGAGGKKACRVAVDPLWFGSYKCMGCIRNKLACSHNSPEKTNAAKKAAASAQFPKVTTVIEERMNRERYPHGGLVEVQPPTLFPGPTGASLAAASPAATTTPAAATTSPAASPAAPPAAAPAEEPAEAPEEAPEEPEA